MLHFLDTMAGGFGGKADGCARLKQAGFPVPDGFAVDPVTLDPDALQSALQGWPHDMRVAVRSSAFDEDSLENSFAGVHETSLDVPRDQVRNAIQRCWDSLYSPRALAYRLRRGLPTQDLRMAVLVQRMVRPVVSGVAFTRLHARPDEMLINAAWGHGEGVVSGLLEPDEIRLDRRSGAVLNFRIGTKRQRVECRDGRAVLVDNPRLERRRLCLTVAQMRTLSTLLVRIEHALGGPRDVEWTFDGTQFWILQARPVTAAAPLRKERRDVEWTRANLVEVLPELGSPQAVELNVRLGAEVMRDFYGTLLAPHSEAGPCIRLHCGRPYFNLSQLRQLCISTGTSPAVVLRGLGHAHAVHPEDDAAVKLPVSTVARNIPSFVRMLARQTGIAERARRGFDRLRTQARRFDAVDPRRATDREHLERLTRFEKMTRRAIATNYALGGMTAYKMALEQVLAGRVADVERFINAQIAAGERTVSAQQGFDLLELALLARQEPPVRDWFDDAHGRLAGSTVEAVFQAWRTELAGTRFFFEFCRFLDAYGHRGHYESDWSLPRFAEDPTPLLFSLAQLVAAPQPVSPQDVRARLAEEARAEWNQLASQNRAVQSLIRWLVGRVKSMYLLREQHRCEVVRVESALRRWHLALAERFVARGWIDRPEDYFFLHLQEVRLALRRGRDGDMRAVVARRRAEREIFARMPMPMHGTTDDLAVHLLHQGEPGQSFDEQVPLGEVEVATWRDDTATGLGLSPGVIEGEVVVIRTPHEFARMKRGAVLVAPATDPAWIPQFTLASGLVVEVGGTLSHAATVVREYGLPAVANVPHATRVLRDGDVVRIDGQAGTVVIVSRAERSATSRAV